MKTINLNKLETSGANQQKKEKDLFLYAVAAERFFPLEMEEKIDGCRTRIIKLAEDNPDYLDNWEFYYRDWKLWKEEFRRPDGSMYIPCGPYTQLVHKLFSVAATNEVMNPNQHGRIEMECEVVIKKPTLIIDYGDRYTRPVLIGVTAPDASRQYLDAYAKRFGLQRPRLLGEHSGSRSPIASCTRADIQDLVRLNVQLIRQRFLTGRDIEGVVFQRDDRIFKLEQPKTTDKGHRDEVGCARFGLTLKTYGEMKKAAAWEARKACLNFKYDYNKAREYAENLKSADGLYKDLVIQNVKATIFKNRSG